MLAHQVGLKVVLDQARLVYFITGPFWEQFPLFDIQLDAEHYIALGR